MRPLHDLAELTTVTVADHAIRLCALHLPANNPAKRRRFLLLHGNPSHMEHFAANIEFLRAHGEVALYDAPGFGASPAPSGPLSLDFLADVAIAYASSVGWCDGVDIIGQSHGGAVAQTVAARSPSLVRSLVLLGTMGYPAHLSMRLAMLPGAQRVTHTIARRADRFPFSVLARAFARVEGHASFDPDPAPSGFLDEELARVIATPEIQRSSVRANDGDPTQQLARQAADVRAPVLLIHGRGDRLVPINHARQLFALIGHATPQSRMVELAGGHMLHLTRPRAVHPVIEAWLSCS